MGKYGLKRSLTGSTKLKSEECKGLPATGVMLKKKKKKKKKQDVSLQIPWPGA
jgi:hypothetical protein